MGSAKQTRIMLIILSNNIYICTQSLMLSYETSIVAEPAEDAYGFGRKYKAGTPAPGAILTKIERGEEGVAMGYYFRVLAILGLEKDLLLVAKDDELGRALQDARLVVGERVSKKR